MNNNVEKIYYVLNSVLIKKKGNLVGRIMKIDRYSIVKYYNYTFWNYLICITACKVYLESI